MFRISVKCKLLARNGKIGNGLSIISDSIVGFETVSIGLFVNVGSVNEDKNQTGISHFLEHMAFKGTKARTALEISYAIESVGGFINAYTGKEVTAFHAKVLKENFELALDIITDIVQNSIFDEKEFDKERGVIIQEIRQTNDTPDDYVFDMFQTKAFEGERLGKQILGSESDILSYYPKDLSNYLNTKYSTEKMVMVASGNVEHDEFCDLASKYTPHLRKFDIEPVEKQVYKGGFIFKRKDLEQSHCILGFEGVSHNDPRKFDLAILSAILGGGMSSRLFQEIREKRGLVYSVFSFNSNYRDTGVFGIYAACEHSKVREVINISISELNKIKESITPEELVKAKAQLKSSLLMGLESSSARMERLAGQFIHSGRTIPMSETLKKINNVTVDSLTEIAKGIFDITKSTLSVIGNGNDIENLDELLK